MSVYDLKKVKGAIPILTKHYMYCQLACMYLDCEYGVSSYTCIMNAGMVIFLRGTAKCRSVYLSVSDNVDSRRRNDTVKTGENRNLVKVHERENGDGEIEGQFKERNRKRN